MDKSKTVQKQPEGRIESRSMNFFNSEYNNRKLDFVPKKVMSNKFIKSDILNEFPETQLLESLLSLDNNIEDYLLKTRLRVQEKYIKPLITVTKKLNCQISFNFAYNFINKDNVNNLNSNQNQRLKDLLEQLEQENKIAVYNSQSNTINPIPCKSYKDIICSDNHILENTEDNFFWSLNFRGKIEESEVEEKDFLNKKFSSFFNKIIFKFEEMPGSPKIKDIEWINDKNSFKQNDGFEIKRSFLQSFPKSVKVCYYLSNNNMKYFITNNDLKYLLGITEASKIQILYHIWNYIKLNNLQDKDNNSIINNNRYFHKIFKTERMEINSLPNRIMDFIRPIDFIEKTVNLEVDLSKNVNEKLFEIMVEIEDLNILPINNFFLQDSEEKLLFSKYVTQNKTDLKNDKGVHTDNFYNSLADYEKTSIELFDKLNKYVYNCNFYNELAKDPINFIDNFKIQQNYLLKMMKEDITESRFDYYSSQFYDNHRDILKDHIEYYIDNKNKKETTNKN